MRGAWLLLAACSAPGTGAIGPFGLESPANGATVSDATPLFRWSPARNALSYRFRLGTDAGMPLVDVTTAAPQATVPGLTAGQTYTWQVDAMDTPAQNGPFTFTLAPAALPAFTLVAPDAAQVLPTLTLE